MNPESEIKKVLENVDARGYLKSRENSKLEYKETFGFGSLAKYLKTIAAFANTQGGILLFGVKDSPRIPLGIVMDKFNEIEQEKITTFLLEYFSPQIFWDIGIVEHDGKSFGYLCIQESRDKPVICKKTNRETLKEGDIYYRYRGQSRTIGFPELKSMKDEIIRKERQMWLDHMERISRIGPDKVALLDLYDGSIQRKDIGKQIIMDKALLEDLRAKVQFIEQGRFSESEGAPTLRVVGEIQASDTVYIPELDPNKDYPYIQKHLAEELGVRPYDAQVLVWKMGLKGNKKYHMEIETGSKTKADKFSNYALREIQSVLEVAEDRPAFLKKVSQEYQRREKTGSPEKTA